METIGICSGMEKKSEATAFQVVLRVWGLVCSMVHRGGGTASLLKETASLVASWIENRR